jgi:ribosomal protein S20
MNVEDLGGADFSENTDNIDKLLDTASKEDVIKSRKAARQKVERRNELKELDKQLDSYYDSLLD